MKTARDNVMNFKTGDKVKVIGLAEDDKTGVIVGKSDRPTVTMSEIVVGKSPKPEMVISWWKVKIDGTRQIKDFPDDRLEKIK